MTRVAFSPSRVAALSRLEDFVPRAGRDYAATRNHDLPGHPHVSTLSPYIRHRLITEEEVLAAVLAKWAPSTAEKFVQEVVWRGYFKGWLERRPAVWNEYRNGFDSAWNRVQTEAGLRRQWENACKGETGIDAFDHWARELAETGYLHNHARMWFASIWIFTLHLPWELGADFFLRHLLDGDPASNTLGWRWVAGLHTPGKHYVARPGNIAKYTEGRFRLARLAGDPLPLDGPPHPEPLPLRDTAYPDRNLRTGLLVSEDDQALDTLLGYAPITTTLVVNGVNERSPLSVSENVLRFTGAALTDTIARFDRKLGTVDTQSAGPDTANCLTDWVAANKLQQVILPYLTQGPANDRLREPLASLSRSGINVVEMRRPYDTMIWQQATAGFFKVKKKIPAILTDLGLAARERA